MVEVCVKGAAGSGKSTIAQLINDYLTKEGFNVMLIEEFDHIEPDADLLHTRAASLKERNKLVKIKTVQTQKHKEN